jgi:valyl-tRNA synthetase
MEGKEVLWLPGTDHAGIATQTRRGKTLKKSGHRNPASRRSGPREISRSASGSGRKSTAASSSSSLKKLGCSCDWTRERFTMDPEYSRCVQKVFVELYKKGLIYRGKRMVNWCPASLTALSDEEVIMKPQKGSLYYFMYEIVERPGEFLNHRHHAAGNSFPAIRPWP